MERGARLGASQAGFLCVPRGNLQYTGGMNEINDARYGDTFREELTRAKYSVTGNPNDLFDDQADSAAELIIAAAITDIKLNACVIPTGETKGEAAIAVEWQIYNPLERRVVHKVVTRGSGRTDVASVGGAGAAMQAAFGQATRGLLADETFHRLVTGREASATAQVEAAPSFQLYPHERASTPIAGRMADLQNGVVTVLTGRGHGSGFFISSDGYLLTNHHVVGERRSVKIRLATGREMPAEVVATNPRRDVALVKTGESGFNALSLAQDEVPVGGEVYALGTPMSERLAATVTRGIVSGYRSVNGMRYIQSDVNVQRGNSGGPLTDAFGNVVGITVSGVAARGTAIGLNFFVPIEDALSSVGIDRMAAPTTPRDRAGSRMVRLNPPAGAETTKSNADSKRAADSKPPADSKPATDSGPAATVAAARPERPSFDGEYSAVVPTDVFSELASFPISIAVRGSSITGSAAAASIGKSDHVCRINGTVGDLGDASFELFCAAMSVDTFKMAQLKGRFSPDPSQGDVMTARMTYTTNENRSGELVWVRTSGGPLAKSSPE
jgi:S1-C subfamily serine protease